MRDMAVAVSGMLLLQESNEQEQTSDCGGLDRPEDVASLSGMRTPVPPHKARCCRRLSKGDHACVCTSFVHAVRQRSASVIVELDGGVQRECATRSRTPVGTVALLLNCRR